MSNVIPLLQPQQPQPETPQPADWKASPEAWAATPEVVRGEIARMVKEFAAGFEKAAVERDATMTEWHEMAAASGKSLRNVIREYQGIEQLLRKDLIGGLKALAKRYDFDIEAWARGVLQREADEQIAEQEQIA